MRTATSQQQAADLELVVIDSSFNLENQLLLHLVLDGGETALLAFSVVLPPGSEAINSVQSYAGEFCCNSDAKSFQKAL